MTTTVRDLDDGAQLAFEATGTVCLAATQARCLWCQAAMRPRRDPTRVVYACRTNTHAIARDIVDYAVWKYHIARVSAPIVKNITDPHCRRTRLHRAYSAVILDPTARTESVVVTVYPRIDI